MLGRPPRRKPVCAMVTAGSWLISSVLTALRKVRLSATARGVGHKLAHPGAGIAALCKGKFGRNDGKARLRGRHTREALAAANGIGKVGTLKFFEPRFIVEQFDLRGTAGLEQINDALGFGSKIRKAGEARLAGQQRAQRAGRAGTTRQERRYRCRSIAGQRSGAALCADRHRENRNSSSQYSFYSFVTVSSRLKIRLATVE